MEDNKLQKARSEEIGVATVVVPRWLGKSSGQSALLVFLTLSLLGCSQSNDDSEEAALLAADDQAISFYEGVLVCKPRPGSESTENPWYQLPAMNNKLRHFPDFAGTAGLSSVANCGDARLFMQKYREYMALVPHFDDNEPAEGLNLPAPQRPQVPESTEEDVAAATRYKLKNGTAGRLSPVVRFTHYKQHVLVDQISCTGTFVARNWIMTAAHCMQTAPGWTKAQGMGAAWLRGWYPYFLEFFGANGELSDARELKFADSIGKLTGPVHQFLDPRFVGFEFDPFFYSSYDFAMLFVLDTEDNKLPIMDPALGTETFPLMRVSLTKNPVAPTLTELWGTGAINQDASGNPVDPPTNGANLYKGSFVPYQPTAHREVEDDDGGLLEQPGWLYAATSPNGPASYLCAGDSGGPLVDRFTIANASGVNQSQPVAFAVHSSSRRTGACSAPGDDVEWVTTQDERDFIQVWVSQWYPGFTCKVRSAVGNVANQYLECWGRPCKDDSVCAAGEFCSHPGSELKNCLGCSDKTCGCIWGQCLPK